ncbi:hypothetical protein DMUE_2514 [Dictyocoela muelleri]|nr:hypothetical protein DMUE_2514 [Dictyocoela muelleri]
MSPEEREQLKKYIKDIQEDLLHPGISKMKLTLSKYVKIPGINKIIYYTCIGCTTCNLEKYFTHNFGITRNEVSATKPNEIISMDITGPISNMYYDMKEPGKNFYILAIVDMYSRYTEIEIIKDINSKTVCKHLIKRGLKGSNHHKKA